MKKFDYPLIPAEILVDSCGPYYISTFLNDGDYLLTDSRSPNIRSDFLIFRTLEEARAEMQRLAYVYTFDDKLNEILDEV